MTSTTHTESTLRGSALYHVDWFLNGYPSSRNHDNAKLTITDLVRV